MKEVLQLPGGVVFWVFCDVSILGKFKVIDVVVAENGKKVLKNEICKVARPLSHENDFEFYFLFFDRNPF